MVGHAGGEVGHVDTRSGHDRPRIVRNRAEDGSVGAALAVQPASRTENQQTHQQIADSHDLVPPVVLSARWSALVALRQPPFLAVAAGSLGNPCEVLNPVLFG